MDPISAAASLLALVAFSGSCAKVFRRIIRDANHAPDEILALSNEISDLSLLLSDIHATSRAIGSAQSPDPTFDAARAIDGQITQARVCLLELESLSSELFIMLPEGQLKFQKLKWLRKKSHVVGLQQKLVGIKRNLAILLQSVTASNAVRIELLLRSSQTSASETPSSIPIDELIDQASNDTGGSTDLAQAGREFSDSTIATPGSSIDSLSQALSLPSGSSTSPGGNGPLPPGTLADDSMSTFLQTVRQVAQFGTMTFHLNRVVRCHGDCNCICHSRSRLQSPSFLDRFLGHLFVGYAGLPIWVRDCDVKTCTNQYSRGVQVSYTFPGWLLSRTVDITAAMTYRNEPHFGLKIRNRVHNNADRSFSLALNGNIQGIKDLLLKRQMSPNDLEYRTGQTALFYAIDSAGHHIDTAKFLLDVVGVDPHVKDDYGLSVAHHVSGKLLANLRTSRAWNYEEIFSSIPGDHTELWDFTHIHCIVLGIRHASLDTTLLNPRYRQLIDVPDEHRRTPLYWAAWRGDVDKVNILLAAGADDRTTDLEGSTPLHAAVSSGVVACVESFLRRGSNVHARTMHGLTPLQLAVASDDNPDLLNVLYLAGASVNTKENFGTSALAEAACKRHPRNAAWLISKGADIDSPDVVGYTPLLEAIRYCHNSVAEVLLQRGANVAAKVINGRTVLHVLASSGDLEGTELLLRYPLPGLFANARDTGNQTAWEIFESRIGQPPGMREALVRLLQQVRSLNGDTADDQVAIEAPQLTDDSEINLEEVFVDAVESQ